MDPMDFDRDELLAIFSAETEENLRQMEEAFVRLESTPDDIETLQAIFRAAHTIKGNAAGLGFPALAKFAHALEDVLDRIRSGALALSTSLATVLLEAVDGLRELAHGAIAGHDSLRRDHLDLIERLEATAESADDAVPVLAPPAVAEHDDRRASIGRRWADLEGAFSRSQTLRVDIEARSDAQPDRRDCRRAQRSAICWTAATQPADRSGGRSASRRRSALPGSPGRGDEDPHGPARPHVPAVLPHRTRRGDRRAEAGGAGAPGRGRGRGHQRHRPPARSPHPPGAQRRGPRDRTAGCPARPRQGPDGTRAPAGAPRGRLHRDPGAGRRRGLDRARIIARTGTAITATWNRCPTASCSG
jgi:HPt (histidine-containing phosphotransfer) domain-containing protein